MAKKRQDDLLLDFILCFKEALNEVKANALQLLVSLYFDSPQLSIR